MKTQAIEVTNLAKSFELSKDKTIQILNGLSLSANYGEFISILGVSGSGKSTLLKCMSGLLQPSQGKVEIQGENIALPLRLSGKKVNNQEILDLLEKLQFKADSKAFPSTLSGGEQQKIAIARAILADSQIIFADEPTGALDSTSRQIVFDILRTLANQGKCILMVTHDIELASKTDRALILKDGLISQEIIKPKSEELTKALGIETDVRER